jgi:hypothetical protein
MMKKYIFILVAFVFYTSLRSQNAIKTTTPCDDELLFKTPGRWLKQYEGLMVVIENADYTRKDLPKYVSQFFVLKWTWNDWPPQAEIAKLIEEKFPFEKLREMIDK